MSFNPESFLFLVLFLERNKPNTESRQSTVIRFFGFLESKKVKSFFWKSKKSTRSNTKYQRIKFKRRIE
ncbi:hypothetical protein CH380_09905 [Leptospira adleri]|uniref:Uncharacterized protein n=1 Tax=Leptospira adleri TaxID=2023186 RepID=A0A2M9YPL5_9LEPT|nr:hypothetical protein CH380_09905 [Leptospira adleri]PJZ62261.1 hypothetical protein CH376_09325 [Leptospira adleri]